jgi:hypothetical protein
MTAAEILKQALQQRKLSELRGLGKEIGEGVDAGF